MMEEVYLLWFLSISMLICSFLSGLVPLAFQLSDNKSRLLALLGSGILVGTALSIIIPEGIDSLYGRHETQQITIPLKPSAVGNKDIPDRKHIVDDSSKDITTTPVLDVTNHQHEQIIPADDRSKQDMTWIVGMSLIVGFVLMLLIEQFSIYQSGGGGGHHHYQHHHQAPEIIHTNHLESEYTLACQDDDIDIGLEEDDKAIVDETTSETKPIKKDHNSSSRITITNNNGNGNNIPGIVSTGSNPNRYYDHARHLVSHKPKAARVTPTLGLVIHAAADGIALGAAATTSHRDVEMIIFFAIMLHKAPAAFSLVVLLLHNGLRPATIRRHLMAFSLSAPIAAIFTYYGLSQSGKEALRRNNATGIAMLFSAGTFLFVATVHVLPELIQNKLLTPREMFFLLGGAFLPLLLTQFI